MGLTMACDQGVDDPLDRLEIVDETEIVIDAHVGEGHEDALMELAATALASFPEDPLEAVDPECSADHVTTVTTTNTVCDGDVMCACVSATGALTVQGPLKLGQTCNVPPGGACSTVQSPAGQSCVAAEASTDEPVCPANCTPMGNVKVSSNGGFPAQCCTATKSLDCCCPGDAPGVEILE